MSRNRVLMNSRALSARVATIACMAGALWWLGSMPQSFAQPAPEAPAADPADAEPQAAGVGVVEGMVTDIDTGVPVPGATVLIEGTSLGAVTDADGLYVIEGVPAGTHQVQMMRAGDVEATRSVEIGAGQTARLDLQADDSQLAGEVIIVTGTRSPEKIFDAPVTVEAVSEETLERTPGTTYMASLADVKGVDFANVGINDQRISMRGFTTQFNSRLITMIDGRLAQLPGSGLPQGTLLPSPGIDMKAIEVVVGPASALYGANAHSGVVNIISKSPWDESGASLTLRGGSQELFDGAMRVAGTVGDSLGWKVSAQLMRATDYEPDCDINPGFMYNTTVCESAVVADYEVSSLKAEGSLYYKFGDWTAKAATGFSETNNFGPTNIGRNHLRDWQTQYQALQVNHPNWYAQVTRTATDSGNSYQLDGLVATADVRARDGRSIAPADLGAARGASAFIDTSSMLDGELQHRNRFYGVDATLGVQVRQYMPDSGGTYLADALGQDLDATELGGYAQADYRLFDDRVRLVGAARVDNHSNYDAQLSPKVAVVGEVATGHKLRAGYNRAFKSPTILENYLYIYNQGANINLVGNRTGFEIRDMDGAVVNTIDPLVPEKVDTLELGYKGILNRHVFVDLVVYNAWYNDFIGPLTPQASPAAGTFAYYADTGGIVGAGTDGEGSLFTYQNFGQAVVRGFDGGVDVRPIDQLTLSGSLGYITRSSDPDDAPPLNVPGLKLKFSATVSDVLLKRSYVRFSGRYTSEYSFTSGIWIGEVPSLFFGDLSAGYTLPELGVTVSGGITNVFGNDTPEILGVPRARRFAFLQVGYAYEGLNF